MTNRLIPLSPAEVAARLKSGAAVLVDIREPDEFARSHVRGALSHPLSGFEVARLRIEAGRDVVFTCRTGMRTGANCDRLAAAVEGEAFVLEGGLDNWAKAGLSVETDRDAPLEITRQVHLAAGLLILTGVFLGFVGHPVFFALPAFVGAGLMFAGATGFCGMARLLTLAPWNRRAAV
jgi:rhodanese-related sulfurtransferase